MTFLDSKEWRKVLALIPIVVCLANEMDEKGLLNSETQARVDLAVNTFFQTHAVMLITCGWAYREDTNLAISDAMIAYIKKNYLISDSNLFSENRSRDTVGDAVFTRSHFEEAELGSFEFHIVTSDYHLERTTEIFRFVFGPRANLRFHGAESNNSHNLLQELKSTDAFQKTFQNLSSLDFGGIIRRMFSEHPFYNGEIHPKFHYKINAEDLASNSSVPLQTCQSDVEN